MSIREERAKQTRTALIGAAQELFLERGYADVGTEEVVARAGVTRGALYHHFENKAALFEAVFVQVDADFVAELRASVEHVTDPFESLLLAMRFFFDGCLDAHLVRLALLDAPVVLGWPRWREIELESALGIVATGLSDCMSAGIIRRQPVEPLAHMFFGSLMELGVYVANSADPVAMRGEVENVLIDLLVSLRIPPSAQREEVPGNPTNPR